MTKSQNISLDMKRSRSRDTLLRKKSLYSVLGSPPQKATNVNFFFSPKDLLSPIEVQYKPNKTINKDLQLSSHTTTSVMSPTSTFHSPFQSIKNSDTGRKPKQAQVHEQRNRELVFENDYPLTSARENRRTEVAKATPMNIYKKLTPNTNTSNSQQINGRINRAQPQGQVPDQSKKDDQIKSQVQNGIQNSNYDQSLALRKKVLSCTAQTESTPVLQTMLQLKQADRPASLMANYSATDREAAIKEMIANRPNDFLKEATDLRHMEAFWDQILQDDFENRGRKEYKEANKSHSQRELSGNSLYGSRIDFNERSKQWMDRKNQKIVSQRKQKEEQEVEGCTFKPLLYSQAKSPKSNELLYQNFLQRMSGKNNNSINATSDSYINYPKKNIYSAGPTITDLKSSHNESLGNHSAIRNGQAPSENSELQKKLYHYILDANNM